MPAHARHVRMELSRIQLEAQSASASQDLRNPSREKCVFRAWLASIKPQKHLVKIVQHFLIQGRAAIQCMTASAGLDDMLSSLNHLASTVVCSVLQTRILTLGQSSFVTAFAIQVITPLTLTKDPELV